MNTTAAAIPDRLRDLAVLRIIAEDPRARPSERMAARLVLKEAGAIGRRHCTACGQRFTPDFRESWRCRGCRAVEMAALIEDDRAEPGTRQAAALLLRERGIGGLRSA